MKILLVALVAAAAAAAPPPRRACPAPPPGPARRTIPPSDLEGGAARGNTYEGDGTAFADALRDSRGAARFACGVRYAGEYAARYFAAINAAQWADGRACGACLTAECVDPRCRVRGRAVQVYVLDRCGECAHGDVDFSYPAYAALTGRDPHRLRVRWRWSDCAGRTAGGVRYFPKDGINRWWLAFRLANARRRVARVRVNGAEARWHAFGGFWALQGGVPAPGRGGGACAAPGAFELVMVSDDGAEIGAVVADAAEEQDLRVNFA